MSARSDDAVRRAVAVAWDVLDLALLDAGELDVPERVVVVDPCRLPAIRGRLGAVGASYACGPGPSLRFTDPAGTVVTVVAGTAALPAPS